ncbi:MAG TPA: hypothetical protein VFU97_01690 [Xanthobacteraceae bacterium]|jgi:hypothetical protein|nr:hypothetical protein [Xanthobacteraceae bacterium]
MRQTIKHERQSRYSPMPRYHFHLVSDHVRVPDCEGVVLSDTWAARREAFLVADELLKPGSPQQHRKWNGWSVQVVDQFGSEVLFVSVGGVAAGTQREAEAQRASPALPAFEVRNGDASPAQAGRHGRHANETFDHTRRLAEEVKAHLERCKQLQRAVARQIQAARETARLSAQLIEQARTLPAGPPS